MPDLALLNPIYERVLRDQRDRSFLVVIAASSLMVLPSGFLMFWVDTPQWWQPVLHVVFIASMLDRFILMNHNALHRPPFTKAFTWISTYVEWVLMPFFGMTPRTYFAHHIAMHHLEANGTDDTSSTMHYQRDSVVDFGRYFFRFLFLLSLVDLVRYMKKKGRTKIMRQMLFGEFTCYAVFIALAFWRPWATLFTFILPFLVTRFLMMAGNWGQHAFVDASDPLNPYLNSITVLQPRYNRRAFNDGYHIVHHKFPRMHWTEQPQELEDNRSEYEEAGALIFDHVDFFMVWAYLMLGRYNWLAKCCVTHQHLSLDERAEMLQQRTRAIHEPTNVELATA